MKKNLAKETEETSSSLKELKERIAPVVSALSGAGSSAAQTVFSAGASLWKNLFWLVLMGAIAAFLTYFFGVLTGGLLSLLLVILIFLIKHYPGMFGPFVILFKGLFFLALLIVVAFALGLYAKMPAWLLLVVEIVLLGVMLKIDSKSALVTLVLTLVFVPFLHYYATEVVPPDSALAQSVAAAEQQFGSLKMVSPTKLYEVVSRGAQKKIAEATGDYYGSAIDAGAKKKLGVFIEELSTTQRPAVFLAGEPITFYTQIKAQSLNFNVNLGLNCEADGVVGKTTPGTAEFFAKELTVEGDFFETAYVDCDLPAEATARLSTGSHEIKITGTFNFATLAYLNTFFIDKEKEKELRRRYLINQFKSTLPSEFPVAVTTSGPVKIGMGAGSLLIGITPRDETGPTVGITIENAGSGHVKSVNTILLMLPKGLSLKEVNAKTDVATKITCFELDETMQKGCDDKIANVYTIDASKIIQQVDVGAERSIYDFVTFRVRTKIEDYATLLGSGATLIPNRINAIVFYDYEFSKKSQFSIRSPEIKIKHVGVPSSK